MGRKITIVLSFLTVFLVVVFIFRKPFQEKSTSFPILSVKALKRSFSVVVETVGELDAARSTVLFSRIRGDQGKIIYIIDDGTKVQKGDVIVRLDPTSFEEKVTQLSTKLQEDEAVLAAQKQVLEWEKIQAEQEVRTAEFDLRAAELDLVKLEKGDGPLELVRLEGAAQELKRDWQEKKGYIADLKALEKKGYANPMEISRAIGKASEAKKLYFVAKRQFESYGKYVLPTLKEKARAQVQRAKMHFEQTKKGSGYKIGKAMAILRQAQQKLDSTESILKAAQTELERTVIRAPIPGIVVLPEAHRGGKKRKPRIGDIVWQNQPLVYLPDVSKMVVKTKIREIDLHKVGIGKPALVRVDAYPDLMLSGRVQSIGVLAESRNEEYKSDKYFSMIIEAREEDQRLRPGMTARVEIECTKVHQVLTVPIHAVFNDGRHSYCYKEVHASFEKREVLIGAVSNDWVQIIAGLTEGDLVAMSQPPKDEIKGSQELSFQNESIQ
jgi:HlyD family secretion protein